MQAETVVSRDPSLLAVPIDDELVVLNSALGHYVCLDAVGRRIWELLETPQSVAGLCAALNQQYAGELEDIQTDVRSFLRELDEEGLIQIHGEEGEAQRRGNRG